MLQLNASQRKGLIIDDKNTLVIAGAGTGKTTLLTERVLTLLRQAGEEGGYTSEAAVRVLRQLVLVTFTEAAATELKERVRRAALEELNREGSDQHDYWLAVNDHLDEAHIGTIDSFYLRLLLRYPEAAGIAPGVSVVDEVVAEIARRQAVRDTLDAAFGTRPPKALPQAAARVVAQYGYYRTVRTLEALLADREEQRGLHLLLCEGHTEALERLRDEIARQVAADVSRRALPVLEFLWQLEIGNDSRKTALQIRDGVEALRGALAREECWSSPDCLSVAGLEALGEGIPALRLPGSLKRDWCDDYRACVQILRDLQGPLEKHLPVLTSAMGEVMDALRPVAEALCTLSGETVKRYQQWKRSNRKMDFADLTEKTYQLLANEETREACRERYRTIWVDEFQDTSRAQAAILFTLAGRKGQPRYDLENAGDYALAPGAFFAVGDPKQSIYRFREADVTVFMETLRKLRKDGQRIVDLEENFRSTRSLVDYFNYCFDRVMGGAKETYEAEPQALTAHRDGEEGKCTRVNFVVFGPEKKTLDYKSSDRRKDEAVQLARVIRHAVESRTPLVWDRAENQWRAAEYRDFAILFQVTTNLSLYEDALRNLNIPYYIHAGSGFFSAQEVNDVIHGLRVLQNPADDLALVGWLRSPMVGISDAGLVALSRLPGTWAERLAEGARREAEGNSGFVLPQDGTQAVEAQRLLTEIRRVRGSATLPELVRLLVRETEFAPVLLSTWHGEQKRANLDKLVALADEMAASAYGLDEFIELIEDRKGRQDREGEASLLSEDEGGVKIMTIHRSKGLEFPIVLLPDLVREGSRFGSAYDYHRSVGTVPRILDPEDPEATRAEASPVSGLVQLLEEREEVAERKRLLYVAATRSRDALYCFIPRYLALESTGAEGPVDGQGAQGSTADGQDLARLFTSTHALADEGPAPGDCYVRGEYEAFTDESPEYVAPAFDTHAAALLAGEPLPGGDETTARELVARCVAPVAPGVVNRTFHATAVLTYAICPQRYEYKYVYGIPEYGVLEPELGRPGDAEAGEDHDDDRAAEVGTLVHQVLAEWDFTGGGDGLAVEDRVRQAMEGEEIRLSEEALARCVAYVRWVVESDYGKRLAGAERLLREAPFRVRWESGGEWIHLIGRLDGLYVEDVKAGRWTVFDYKTNRKTGPVEELARKYETQLNIYQTAVEHTVPGAEVSAELVCTDYREVVPIRKREAFEAETLPRLAQGLIAQEYGATPTANCHEYCPYATICPAVRERLPAPAGAGG